MHETAADLERLQDLLDRSYPAAGEHLLSIHTRDRRLSAPQMVDRLQGMRLLVLATVGSNGRPFTGPVDGSDATPLIPHSWGSRADRLPGGVE